MPTQNISDRKMASVITASINNTPSSEALMKHAKNYRTDDDNRIYRQLADGKYDVDLSPSSSISGGISVSGLATPVYVASSNTNIRKDYIKTSPNYISKAQWCAVVILTFVNLINYMDRYTIAGKLKMLGRFELYWKNFQVAPPPLN